MWCETHLFLKLFCTFSRMRAYQSAALTSLPPPSPVTFFFCIAGSTSFVLFCSSIVLCHIFVNGWERSLCRCSSAGGRFGSLLTFGTDAIPFISYRKWASASWERKQRGGVGWGGDCGWRGNGVVWPVVGQSISHIRGTQFTCASEKEPIKNFWEGEGP